MGLTIKHAARRKIRPRRPGTSLPRSCLHPWLKPENRNTTHWRLIQRFFRQTPQQSQLSSIRVRIYPPSHGELRRRIEPLQLAGGIQYGLSRIGGLRRNGNPKRHTPIFQRDAAGSRKQAGKDAASALSALWKVAESSKR